MLVSCVVVVWLGCISVIPTTVRKSATSDSKENKQADASTRLFSKIFSAARCCEIVRQQSMKAYLHMYNGNAQQYPLCAASCVTKDLLISPRLSPTTFYRDENSVLLRAHLCTAVLIDSMRRILNSKLLIRSALRSIYTCTTKTFSRTLCAQHPVSSRTLCAQHPVSRRVFPSLSGYRLRIFIAEQIEYSTVDSC